MNMRSLFLLSLAIGLASEAGAGELRTRPSAVVELFTSQGCSSCPPADALLSRIGVQPEVIALAYHVDYWDYIGWPDTFARPAFGDYQHAYFADQGSVITPQFMINGVTGITGQKLDQVPGAVAVARLPVRLDLDLHDGMLGISAVGDAAYPEARIWLVTFVSAASVAIARGENQNRTIEYSHIATSRQVIGMWVPDSGASVTLPVADLLGPANDGAAILVQEDEGGRPGRILGAAAFRR